MSCSHADQPHGDFSFLLIRALCKTAHEAGVIVAFNGDGPDEAMAGFTHNQDFLTRHPGPSLDVAAYFDHICYFAPEKRARLLTPDFAAALPDPVEAYRALIEPFDGLSPIDQIAAYETSVLSPGNNLIKTDRMGAGMSIEGRSPFLDHRMSEMMMRMPARAARAWRRVEMVPEGLWHAVLQRRFHAAAQVDADPAHRRVDQGVAEGLGRGADRRARPRPLPGGRGPGAPGPSMLRGRRTTRGNSGRS